MYSDDVCEKLAFIRYIRLECRHKACGAGGTLAPFSQTQLSELAGCNKLLPIYVYS